MKSIAGALTVAAILCFHYGSNGWGLGLAIVAAILWLLDVHIEFRDGL